MELFFIGVIGLIIGSFLNVCIYRIPRGESISYPPSHCGSCSHKLSPKDLIPVISYTVLQGRCRYCKAKIAIQYPLIEITDAILYILIYMRYGYSILTIKYCIFASLLIVIGAIDYKTQDVYTLSIVFGIVIGILFIGIEAFIYENISPLHYIIGAFIGAAIIGIIVFFTRGMGEGDIEIAGLCGLFLGTKLVLLDLFLAVIIGGIAGIVILSFRLKDKKDSIAFGPCIAIGAFISMLLGNELINAYLSLCF